jgi:abortive infection bacteriophage resistance protein
MSEARIPYAKSASSFDDLLNHWAAQGLGIAERNTAKHYLQFIGYYRLRGYARRFQILTEGPNYHHFHPGTTFEDIIHLYKFDRKLRASLMDALERIEVAIRSVVSERMSNAHGPHWFLNPDSFMDDRAFQKTCQLARDLLSDSESEKKHSFLAHYRKKYNTPDLPPGWMLFEILSFGNISHIYSGLSSRLKKDIASIFDLSPAVLSSWMRALSYLRNLCAHHSRVWNRTFTIKPENDKKLQIYQITRNDCFYVLASIIHYFLRRIKGASQWAESVRAMVGVRPLEEQLSMGFPDQWQNLSIWQPPSAESANLL